MHNYYTYLFNKTVYELLERKRGKGDAVLFARSATVGGQKFPVHWGGDCWSNYESMEESLRGGLESTSYRVPWVYDEESVDAVRFFTKLKMSLMSYIYKASIETSQTGVPTMRSMVLEFTEDKTCHYVDN